MLGTQDDALTVGCIAVLMSATCIPNLRQTLDPNLPNGVVITAVEVTIGAYRVKGGVAAIGSGRMATNVVGHPARFVSASSEAVWCPKYWLEDRLTKWAICIINLPQKVLGIEPAILGKALSRSAMYASTVLLEQRRLKSL